MNEQNELCIKANLGSAMPLSVCIKMLTGWLGDTELDKRTKWIRAEGNALIIEKKPTDYNMSGV